jgi:hypothetical protein
MATGVHKIEASSIDALTGPHHHKECEDQQVQPQQLFIFPTRRP